ncbi:Putative cell-wall binding lipoprotein [Gracilibacillus ureilyticus]|uniref:Putative cell-wall binding lipoprotein n=1 Tax=Gracilibacillus ureilyticus TaxID=531814 RepID=A0A1H9TKK4_9BACI|nr:YkyA family protein [Gracilibacillus ureilyticus]SER97656.1 Putative cell-wall binding lipoprotein [Gracilibacillus ureilyticus]
MKKLLIGITLVLLISGCSGESTAKQMYAHLEKAWELEETFADQQDPFTQLEEKDNEIYNELIELSADEEDKITELQKEAFDNIEERRSLLETEKESIENAEEEFTKVKDYVEDLNEEVKPTAEEMIKAMENRFSKYYQLYEAYLNLLDEDHILYELFAKEDLTEDELIGQINVVNEKLENVRELNASFNQFTDSYNELKEQFYEEAGLNVEFEE